MGNGSEDGWRRGKIAAAKIGLEWSTCSCMSTRYCYEYTLSALTLSVDRYSCSRLNADGPLSSGRLGEILARGIDRAEKTCFETARLTADLT